MPGSLNPFNDCFLRFRRSDSFYCCFLSLAGFYCDPHNLLADLCGSPQSFMADLCLLYVSIHLFLVGLMMAFIFSWSAYMAAFISTLIIDLYFLYDMSSPMISCHISSICHPKFSSTSSPTFLMPVVMWCWLCKVWLLNNGSVHTLPGKL